MVILKNFLTKRIIFCAFNKGIWSPKKHFSTGNSELESKLLLSTKDFNTTKYLTSKIQTSGPITIAEFMKTVLTNPCTGYYMKKDVFGTSGDFITSPEISQLFGEVSRININIVSNADIIAVWFANEWSRIGRPRPMQIVELGPGRGTMMSDILRVFAKFKFTEEISCHLVEISPELSQIQAKTLVVDNVEANDASPYQRGESMSGIPVHWYKSLEEVPRQFSCVIAHEFFDALPIHKFQKTEDGWREVLVDIDPAKPESLRYVISRMATPASAIFVNKEESRDHVEVSPRGGVIVQQLAERLEEDGGVALIADYGHTGDKTDTFRAFKNHRLHDPLLEPGSADLTADVDFKYLQACVSDKLVTFGPVTQRQFLYQMHADKRLEILTKMCKNEDEKQMLESGFRMMTDEAQMGLCFKFLALYPLVLKDFLSKQPPPAFVQNS